MDGQGTCLEKLQRYLRSEAIPFQVQHHPAAYTAREQLGRARAPRHLLLDALDHAVEQPVHDLLRRQVDAAVHPDVLPGDQQVVADEVQRVLHRPGTAVLGDQGELGLDPVRLGVDQGPVHVPEDRCGKHQSSGL